MLGIQKNNRGIMGKGLIYSLMFLFMLSLDFLKVDLSSESSAAGYIYKDIRPYTIKIVKNPSEFEDIFKYGLELFEPRYYRAYYNENILKKPIRKEFETNEDFGKRENEYFKKQASFKENFEQNIYQTTLTYKKDSSSPLTFRLEEYDIREKGFPISRVSTWKKKEYGNEYNYDPYKNFLLIFENIPILSVSIEKGKEIRKNEENLALEVTFRIVSCTEKRDYHDKYNEMESVIRVYLLSAVLKTEKEIFWEWEAGTEEGAEKDF